MFTRATICAPRPGTVTRAQQIGAALEVSSDARGTRIALSYPLPATA